MPYSSLYGNKLESIINEALKDHALIDIDPYTDGIIPADDVESMDLVYVLDNTKSNLGGSGLLIITGVKYGRRDDFTINIKADGKEYKTEKKALNGKEVAFVAEVPNTKDLEIIYKNSFEKPDDIAFEVADGIQDGLNDLSPIGNPISNNARDKIADAINSLALCFEETKTDKDGNVKTNKDGSEKKEYKEVSLNYILGDGDVGVIVTEVIYKIPAIGQIIKPLLKVSGGDDKLAEIVRKAVGQTKVKSYAKIANGKIYIKKFDSLKEMESEVSNSKSEAKVDIYDYADDISEDKETSISTNEQTENGDVTNNNETVVSTNEQAEDANTPDNKEPVMPTSVQIEYGDTVGNISLRYYGDYSMIDKIYEANKDYFAKTKDTLNIGDILVLPIPAKFNPPVADDHTKVYTVKAGDTLAIIAEYFYGDASQYTKIANANVGIIPDPNKIFEGQKIAISVENNEPTKYIVKEGDTVVSIAQKHYGSSDGYQKILDANEAIDSSYMIYPGQVILLP